MSCVTGLKAGLGPAAWPVASGCLPPRNSASALGVGFAAGVFSTYPYMRNKS